jgi:hypothetical protein
MLLRQRLQSHMHDSAWQKPRKSQEIPSAEGPRVANDGAEIGRIDGKLVRPA